MRQYTELVLDDTGGGGHGIIGRAGRDDQEIDLLGLDARIEQRELGGFDGQIGGRLIVSGNVALGKKVWVRLRYLSADSIAGPTYKSDVLQLDLNGKF